jgi:hypothetical protein
VLLALAVLLPTLLTTRPIPLDPERQAVQAAVEKLGEWGLKDAVVYTNHPWFTFLSGRDRYDRVKTPLLRLETVLDAPPGSLVLWENHYGNRLWGNVPLARLEDDERFERLLWLEAGKDRNFQLLVYQKVG